MFSTAGRVSFVAMASNLDRRRWERARAQVLARDGHRCVAEERYGGEWIRCPTTRGLAVHHRVRPEDGGDPYAPGNLLTLCRSHHQRLHLVGPQRVSRARERVRRPNAGAYRPFSRAA